MGQGLDMQEMAIAILGVFGLIAAAITKWALGQKKIAETKAQIEASKRMEIEVRSEVDKMDISRLIDESNKRHGRE